MVKILVAVKRVVDYAVKIRVAGDKKGLEINKWQNMRGMRFLL
jgi:hypothetical protein